jgi:4-hydroxy-tetrahydrodipicolinate synthase
VDGHVPLVVNVSGPSITDSLDLARLAADVGARGIAATPPFYFRVEQGALLEYAWQLASDSPLPLFLYNIPKQTGLQFEVGTVERLLGHENIVGMKDSSGDVDQFDQLQTVFAQHPGKSLLVGAESMLGDAVVGGAQGGVCGGANLFPRLYVELYEAASQRHSEKTSLLGAAVANVGRHMYQLQDGQWSYIASTKYVLSLLGICGDLVLPPLRQLCETNKNLIKKNLATLAQQGVTFITDELVDHGFSVPAYHS